MAYLRRHPEFVEGPQYVDKYTQLLSRALALVKNQVCNVSVCCVRAHSFEEKYIRCGRWEGAGVVWNCLLGVCAFVLNDSRHENRRRHKSEQDRRHYGNMAYPVVWLSCPRLVVGVPAAFRDLSLFLPRCFLTPPLRVRDPRVK